MPEASALLNPRGKYSISAGRALLSSESAVTVTVPTSLPLIDRRIKSDPPSLPLTLCAPAQIRSVFQLLFIRHRQTMSRGSPSGIARSTPVSTGQDIGTGSADIRGTSRGESPRFFPRIHFRRGARFV